MITMVYGPLADELQKSHQREIVDDELAEARRRLDQIIEVLMAIDERRRGNDTKALDTGALPADNARLAKRTYH